MAFGMGKGIGSISKSAIGGVIKKAPVSDKAPGAVSSKGTNGLTSYRGGMKKKIF